ncbi:transporter [Candidatus Saganbacteria bacterium]|nr:transporter [Candidatus Saganbacteria bacterium]
MIITPALAYRPLGTEDAGVAGKGVVQTEVGFDYLKWNDGKIERNLLWAPIYGLTDNLEVSAEIPYLFHANPDGTSPSGVGDINLVVKGLLADENEKSPAVAVKGVVKLDNGDYGSGLGSGDKDYSLFAVASKTLGRYMVHAQVGYTRVGKAQNAALRDIPLYGLAFDYSLTDAFHLLAEINGNRHPDSAATDDPRNWLMGITYKLSDKIILDLAGRGGLTKASPDWSLTTGLSATL